MSDSSSDSERNDFRALFEDTAQECRRTEHSPTPKVSDLCKGDLQYVDLVLAGGSMLGIAHAGYIHALEDAGIRLRKLGGTSAGALSAALLTAMPDPSRRKALDLACTLATMPVDRFLDRLSARLYFKSAYVWRRPCLQRLLQFVCIARVAIFRHLIRGQAFEDWLESRFRYLRGDSWHAELAGDRHTTFEFDSGSQSLSLEEMLIVVASDIVTESKIELPRMEHLFDTGERANNLARYARASTSVPLVFSPVAMRFKAGYEEAITRELELDPPLPEFIQLVDGGLMSNFPVSVFHLQPGKVPQCPTFGVKFRPSRTAWNRSSPIWRYVSSLGKTMLDVSDEQFIRQHPDYGKLVTSISTEGIDRYNVYMDRDAKTDLFRRGYQAGLDFLYGRSAEVDTATIQQTLVPDQFDWEGYQGLRQQLGVRTTPSPQSAGATTSSVA
jgi:NTE family protein